MAHFKFRLIILISIFAAAAQACDLCGCYVRSIDSNPQPTAQRSFSIFAATSEQFTYFATERLNGEKVANPVGEYLDSSITQVVLGSSFFDGRFSVQANVPLIYRSFKRAEGVDIEKGSVSGPGDMSFTASMVVLNKEGLFHDVGLSKDGKSGASGEPDFSATVSFSASLKLPTGDSGELGMPEVDVEGAPASGIGGHDLTLGTGSVDGIFGAQTLVRYRALFFQGDAQYACRGRGTFSYRFANDFSWSGGPGVYLLRKSNRLLALQFVLSGETKGYDSQLGQTLTDTGVSSLYLGPRILGAVGRLSAEAGIDLPVIMNTTDFQLTPNFRIRAGLTYEF
jgi:hypothetical protein